MVEGGEIRETLHILWSRGEARFRSRRRLTFLAATWQESTRDDSCRHAAPSKTTFNTASIDECNSNLNWRSRVRAPSVAARYETSLPPSISNPEDLDGSGGESIKGKSFSRLHLPFVPRALPGFLFLPPLPLPVAFLAFLPTPLFLPRLGRTLRFFRNVSWPAQLWLRGVAYLVGPVPFCIGAFVVPCIMVPRWHSAARRHLGPYILFGGFVR